MVEKSLDNNFILWTRSKPDSELDLKQGFFKGFEHRVIFAPMISRDFLEHRWEEFIVDLQSNRSDRNKKMVVIVSSMYIVRKLIDTFDSNIKSWIEIACFGDQISTVLTDNGFQLLNLDLDKYRQRSINTIDQLIKTLCDKNLNYHFVCYYPLSQLAYQNYLYSFSNKIQCSFITPIVVYHCNIAKYDDLNKQVIAKIKGNYCSLIIGFASPSAVQAYAKLKLPFGRYNVAIGQTTSACLLRYGIKAIISPKFSSKSLASKCISILG